MSYDSNVNQAAKAELERRRKLAEETARRNLEGFLQGCPRAGEIRRELQGQPGPSYPAGMCIKH